ncbi:MAG TPA: serine hydrolase [Candidatus Sulfotelmatobacter sp.]|nr:serine hydrolase [Candidatus Sulfotelmatobacter sp.]
MNLDAALAYAERHQLDALIALRGREVVLERYGAGWNAARPHPLYSGTKSFWGVLAVLAEREGLLALDEPVGATIADWAADAVKRRVTLRELLQLTSGIGFGGLGSAVPTYEKALAVVLKDPPGAKFTYGGIPLQVFGAVLARKLEARGRTPHAYLRERLLDPIGLQIGSWRTLRDGTQPLPTGAFVAAGEWLKYGQLVRDGGDRNGTSIVPRDALAACFVGSAANPRYGLAWWLSPLEQRPDIVYASGAGGQALYVLPADDLVVVKYGRSNSYDHAAFLRRLTG